jgi:hypothetical protein
MARALQSVMEMIMKALRVCLVEEPPQRGRMVQPPTMWVEVHLLKSTPVLCFGLHYENLESRAAYPSKGDPNLRTKVGLCTQWMLLLQFRCLGLGLVKGGVWPVSQAFRAPEGAPQAEFSSRIALDHVVFVSPSTLPTHQNTY